jgi:hypothetical protein
MDIPDSINLPSDAQMVIVVDMSKPSAAERAVILTIENGQPVVTTKTVASHGRGSDANNDGIADKFSNAHDSHATSLGTYRIAEQYYGKYGMSYRLDGLDATNSNARNRAIVIHEAPYVTKNRVGRSFGCIALPIGFIRSTLAPLLAKYKNAYLIVTR